MPWPVGSLETFCRIEVPKGEGTVTSTNVKNLEIDGGEAEGEVLELVAAHIKHMELATIANLGGQLQQPVLAQRQHPQVHQVTNLRGQKFQPVPVQVQVCQLGQVPCNKQAYNYRTS